MKGLRACLTVILLSVSGGLVHAHDLGLNGIKLIKRASDTVISVTVPLSKLRLAEGWPVTAVPAGSYADQAIRKRLDLALDGARLGVTKANLIIDPPNDLVNWQLVRPGTFRKFSLGRRLFVEDSNSKTLVSVMDSGQVVDEVLLDSEHPSFGIQEKMPSPSELVSRYLKMGAMHILSGADHVLFVLGLLLLGGSLKSLLKIVTSFTVAHSITLCLAVTGVLNPSPRLIEPLIALSIVAVAFENLREKKEAARDFRPLVAFAFGLIHGFGFAGALMNIGLTGNLLGLSLVSFNLGVEFGQAGIVLLAAPMVAWMVREHPVVWQRTVIVGSSLIAMAGGYWVVDRLM